MAYQVGDVVARIGLQVMTGQFNTASQAFRSLGYDAVFMGKQFTTATGAMGAFEKKIGGFSSNAKLISGSISGISTALKGATTEWQRVENHFEKVTKAGTDLKSNLLNLGKGIGGLTANLGLLGIKLGLVAGAFATIATMGVATWVYNVASSFQSLQIRMESALRSSRAAEEAMAWIEKFAKETPLGVKEVADGFVRLTNAAFDATKALPIIVDTVSAMGGGEDYLRGITKALIDMSNKTKGISQELNIQLPNWGISASRLLTEHFGKAIKSADDAIKEFGNGAGVAMALLEAMQAKYSGSAQKLNETARGQLEKLKENFQIFAKDVGESGFLGGIYTMLSLINNKFDEMASNGSLKSLASDISNYLLGAMKTAFDLTISLVKAFQIFKTTVEGVIYLFKNDFVDNVRLTYTETEIKSQEKLMQRLIEKYGEESIEVENVASKLEKLYAHREKLNKGIVDGTQSMIENKQALESLNKIQDFADSVYKKVIETKYKDSKASKTTGDSLEEAIAKIKKAISGLGSGVEEETNKAIRALQKFTIAVYMNKNTIDISKLVGLTDSDLNEVSKMVDKITKELSDELTKAYDYANEHNILETKEYLDTVERLNKEANDRINAMIDVRSERYTAMYNSAIAKAEEYARIMNLNESIKQTEYATSAIGASDYQKIQITYESQQSDIMNKWMTGQISDAEYVAQMNQNIAQTNQSTADLMWSAAQNIGNAIGSNVGGATDIVKSSVDIFKNGLNWSNGLNLMANGISLMAANNPDMQKALEDINEFVGKIFAIAGKIIAPILKAILPIVDSLEPLLEMIGDFLSPVAEILSDTIAPLIEATNLILAPIFQVLSYIADILNVGGVLGDITGSNGIGGVAGSSAAGALGVYGGSALLANYGLVASSWTGVGALALGGMLLDQATGGVISGTVGGIVDSVFGGLFHDGGSVGAPFKYHDGASAGLPSGTFRADEVPAVLQTGEIVLSRSTVAEAKRAQSSDNESVSTETQMLVKVYKELKEMRKNQTDWTIYGLPTVTA